MKVKVHYYGLFRDLIGRESEEVVLRDGATAGHIIEGVLSLHPELEGYKESIFISVNHESATTEKVIKESDHISIFPPVGGG